MKKTALITGITGQDGSYLAELLLEKGYEVYGLFRRGSTNTAERIEHLLKEREAKGDGLHLVYGDMTDSMNLVRLMLEIKPDEIYNLAAQSHVAVSFEEPEYTANADGIGVLRVLEAVRIAGLTKPPGSTRRPLPSCSARWRKFPRRRLRRSIPVLPMRWRNCTATGSRSITGKPTVCLR